MSLNYDFETEDASHWILTGAAEITDTYSATSPSHALYLYGEHSNFGPVNISSIAQRDAGFLGAGLTSAFGAWINADNAGVRPLNIQISVAGTIYADNLFAVDMPSGWSFVTFMTVVTTVPGPLTFDFRVVAPASNGHGYWLLDDIVVSFPLATGVPIRDFDRRDPVQFRRGVKDSLRGILLSEDKAVLDRWGRTRDQEDVDEDGRVELSEKWPPPPPRRDWEP